MWETLRSWNIEEIRETQALPSGAYEKLAGNRINDHTTRYLTGIGLRATEEYRLL